MSMDIFAWKTNEMQQDEDDNVLDDDENDANPINKSHQTPSSLLALSALVFYFLLCFVFFILSFVIDLFLANHQISFQLN